MSAGCGEWRVGIWEDGGELWAAACQWPGGKAHRCSSHPCLPQSYGRWRRLTLSWGSSSCRPLPSWTGRGGAGRNLSEAKPLKEEGGGEGATVQISTFSFDVYANRFLYQILRNPIRNQFCHTSSLSRTLLNNRTGRALWTAPLRRIQRRCNFLFWKKTIKDIVSS